MKKILKNTIFKCFSFINKFIPKKDNYILLYSANKGIMFNLLPLKKYLVDNGYLNGNKIICGIESKKYMEYDGCKYVTHCVAIFYYFFSKHVFYTAGQLPIKPSNNQMVMHLIHGMPFKSVGRLSNIQNGYEDYSSYFVVTSDIFKDVMVKCYGCGVENVIVNSEPMTDIFFQEYKKYDFGSFEKVILWVPTFRQSSYLGYNDSEVTDGLPLFEESDLMGLNEVLRNYNYRLIVKFHPFQNTGKCKQKNFSNLNIMSDEDLKKQNWNIYELLPQIDILLADYSSLFLQFLLLDKPMAFVMPDFDEYSKKRGFVFENPKDLMPGVKITTKKEFYNFLEDVSLGKDEYVLERKRVKKIMHKYSDDKSCERLVDFSKIKKC